MDSAICAQQDGQMAVFSRRPGCRVENLFRMPEKGAHEVHIVGSGDY